MKQVQNVCVSIIYLALYSQIINKVSLLHHFSEILYGQFKIAKPVLCVFHELLLMSAHCFTDHTRAKQINVSLLLNAIYRLISLKLKKNKSIKLVGSLMVL